MRTIDRSNEQGIAMIIALFMVLAMSVLGATLMFVSQTETLSSMNYRMMSQARYGAESGIHQAANYLLSTAYTNVEPGTATDPFAPFPGVYVTSGSPVKWNNADVILSSDPGVTQNYPIDAVKTAFANAATGTLDVASGTVTYTATARLLSMRQIDDRLSNKKNTLQTWEISAKGKMTGAQTAEVEVSAIIDVQPFSLYTYAAFADDTGCSALQFEGGAQTNSYDSSTLNPANPVPVFGNYDGNVGTNGNLFENGGSVINGSLSTPREGVGTCSAANVTGASIVGNGTTVSDGLTKISEIDYPTPVIPDPGTGSQNIQKTDGCASGGVPYCTQLVDPGPPVKNLGGKITAPPGPADPNSCDATTCVLLGDVSLTGGATLQLTPGTYVVNSIDIEANSQIQIVPDASGNVGKVTFLVKGDNQTTPIKIAGNGISNPSLVPNNLEFRYAGDGQIDIEGGTNTAALFYAPNADGTIGGGSDLYGAIITKKMTVDSTGAFIHWDRSLQRTALAAGNPMMSAFTWKNFSN
jgi:type IV pilus assembly PilX-like protein